MEYKNKVAALACFAVVSVGMTGCSSSSSPSDTPAAGAQPAIGERAATTPAGAPPADEACPIPLAVQQPIVLDQDSTRNALGFAATALDLGYYLTMYIEEDGIFYGGMIPGTKTKTKAPTVSKETAILGDRIKNIQEGTSGIKARMDEGSLVFGDNLPCDSGTYSMHMSEDGSEGGSHSGGENDGVYNSDYENHGEYMEKVELSFDQCLLNEGDDLIMVFGETLLGTSLLAQAAMGFNGTDDAPPPTFIFNGSASIEYNNNYSYNESYWGDITPDDAGNSDQDIRLGEVKLVTNALSVRYIENEVEKANYSSHEDIFISYDISYNSEYTVDYANENNEGNHTNTRTNNYTINWNVAMDISETFNELDSNVSVNLTALCYTANGKTRYDSNHEEYVVVNEPDQQPEPVTADNDNTNIFGIKSDSDSSGYLAFSVTENGEPQVFVDLFTDLLAANYTYQSTSSSEAGVYTESDGSEATLNGTVGSMLMGGSVAIVTELPWKMSSAFTTDRNDMELSERVGGYHNPLDFIENTPYEGRTVLSGTNTATVEFMFEETEEDGNITYGKITIDDNEPEEYGSIEEMISDNFSL
jgi:hypothetical protein